MVEELIAEGNTPEQVEQILVADYGMTQGQAQELVSVATGGPGDVIIEPEAPAP